ncbi:SDR family oxidoreductase [Pseudoroseomonas ludipueritiae]|uniref:SDR family oxidoreductase n=1 Tax=Pseudoroseomonas ludipueritiae TaxID=198093 RepID=A0ABR7RA56_9PROT|nr:SDR family oxidoreductase [Pseudoroseomonas ludipueritiae]MBC9178578.1 SDR family oxidoreductase [Pseudoroseomonas ludipueritiae]
MECRLDGQVAVVTGGSSGLGQGIALLFGRAGAAVVVNYHGSQEGAEDVVRQIEAGGGRAVAVRADVSQQAEVDAMFAKAVEHFGAVDILVANSGIQKDAAFTELTLEDWRKVIDTNLTGQFLCAQAAVRQFRQQGDRGVSKARGKILHMSSVHEVVPWAGHANYAASKGGVSLLMRTLAQEVAEEGIRVNGIAPGAIRTAINADALEGEGAEEVLRLIPYNRIGDPEDVARVALFLASDMADYVVGATLFVDGGMTLYPGFRDNG